MSGGAKNFYNWLYAEGRKGKGPSGVLGWIFLRLRKYELHRVKAAFSLLEKGEKLIDLGCGDGTLLALAKKYRKYNKLYGVDIASNVVQRAKKTLKKELGKDEKFTLVATDLDKQLPFKNNCFDAAVCLAVLEHIFDPYFTVKEIKRVLKRNGILILEVPNLVWFPRRLSILIGNLPKTGDEEGWDSAHLHYFTFKATKKLLEDFGFGVEYAGTTGIFSGFRNLWPSLLGGDILIKARKI
jgi:ubiquinone/menaquinone biosynthesis C-methylase UbiE